MKILISLLVAALFLQGVIITDAAGLPQTQFAPGDIIKIQFDKPGNYEVTVIDVRTGYVVLKKSFNINYPGTYELWRTSPQMAEGRYIVYISTGEVIDITITRYTVPIAYIAATAIAAAGTAAAYFLWKKHATPPPSHTRRPTLLLPNGIRIELGDVNIFGRETFLKLGVPPDIARYVSRTHFVIKRHGSRYYIEDLGSKNGTHLNGRSIKGLGPQPLKPGDIINIAKVLEVKFT